MRAAEAPEPALLFTLLYVACYVIVRGGVAALYLTDRPNTTWKDKLFQLVVGTPLSIVLNLHANAYQVLGAVQAAG